MGGKRALRPSEDHENHGAADSSPSALGMSRQAGRAWRPIRNVLSRRESSMTSMGETVAGRKVSREGVKLHRKVSTALICVPYAVACGGKLLPDSKTDSQLCSAGHITKHEVDVVRME